MVACLQGWWETFLWARDVAWAVEERSRFVAVLPNRLLEILSCGGVVSAHLSESRHGSSLDKLKPFGGSKFEESGRLPVRGERVEARLRSEDLFILVFEVVQEGVPFFECLGLDFGKGSRAGDKEGEEVAGVSAFHVGGLLGVLVGDLHLVESTMAGGPDQRSSDVRSFGKQLKHVLLKGEGIVVWRAVWD